MNICFLDLNVGDALDHLSLTHGVNEIISNALDEHKLKNISENVSIYKLYDYWIIKDMGHGIESKHFTMNANKEKTIESKCIGKFGYGLKDAIVIFMKYNIEIEIFTPHGKYTPVKRIQKNTGVYTIHIIHNKNIKIKVGTEVRLKIADDIINDSKSNFILWSDSKLLFRGSSGEIYENTKNISKIYCNGLCISQGKNYKFSYNITNPGKTLCEAINRDRENLKKASYRCDINKIIKELSKSDCINKQGIISYFKYLYVENGDRTGELAVMDNIKKLGIDENGKNRNIFINNFKYIDLKNNNLPILNTPTFNNLKHCDNKVINNVNSPITNNTSPIGKLTLFNNLNPINNNSIFSKPINCGNIIPPIIDNNLSSMRNINTKLNNSNNTSPIIDNNNNVLNRLKNINNTYSMFNLTDNIVNSSSNTFNSINNTFNQIKNYKHVLCNELSSDELYIYNTNMIIQEKLEVNLKIIIIENNNMIYKSESFINNNILYIDREKLCDLYEFIDVLVKKILEYKGIKINDSDSLLIRELIKMTMKLCNLYFNT